MKQDRLQKILELTYQGLKKKQNLTKSQTPFQKLLQSVNKEKVKDFIQHNKDDVGVGIGSYNLSDQSKDLQINDYLDIPQQTIDFEYCLPGQQKAKLIKLINKSDQNIIVQLELEDDIGVGIGVDLGVGLFSLQQKELMIPKKTAASFKIKLQVPNMKTQGNILRKLLINMKGSGSKSLINLTCHIQIPVIECNKMLCMSDMDVSFIKIAGKRNARMSEAKLVFQILTKAHILSIKVDLIQNQEEEDSGVMVIVKQNHIYNLINGQFLVVLSILNQKFQVQEGKGGIEIRLIILLQIESSSLIQSFLALIELF